jgi:WD40 repeat protein
MLRLIIQANGLVNSFFFKKKKIEIYWFFLVSCSADLSVRLWDFQTYQCVKTMHGQKKEILSFISLFIFSF